MRRTALLYCANIDLPRFKVLRARDQLPFVAGTVDELDSRGANYSLHNAFALRLMLDLIGGEGDKGAEKAGVVPSYSAKVIRHALMDMSAAQLSPETGNLWAGVVIFEDEATEGKPALRFSRWFAGDIADFPAWLDERKTREDGAVPIRSMIVNAAQAARFVRKRAADMGLPEADEQL